MSDSQKHKLSDRTLQIDRSTLAEQMLNVNAIKKKASFIILGGLDIGSVRPIDKSKMIIGRDPKCDLVLRDDGISRHHAEVTHMGLGSVAIRDLDSTNGTFIEGKRIKDAVLRDGEKVLLGRRTILKFVLQDELEQSYQQQMYESSTRDGLTGAYNRKYFIKKTLADLSFSRRHNLPFTLLLLDIDFFKKINDTYGHRTGDQVLVRVTETIHGIIRAEDSLARYGGEEFAIVAQGTDINGGSSLAERIRSGIESKVFKAVDGSEASFHITVSIGVATVSPGITSQPESVVSAADSNLYQAKNTGRNRVVSSEVTG
ncbi:MAG: GGDEF domain-containing protein [Myxococcota bacterium]|nr:GGDEF domain-containing protein [Myxococcota bacterium]